jgi:ArsR family transcriptional regulator
MIDDERDHNFVKYVTSEPVDAPLTEAWKALVASGLPLGVGDDGGRPACTERGLPDVGPLTEERIASIAKALAHPARVRILEQFACCVPRYAQEIVDECQLAQSTVSEHLRILRDADVLSTRRDGSKVWYCLRRSVLAEFAEAVEAFSLSRLAGAPHATA